MITGDYAREMARYGHWQNTQLAGFLQALPQEELTRDRGAFFGSIMGTANHLLWGDWIWISRFDKGEGPGGGIPESVSLCADLAQWLPLRDKIDARIADWASGLGDGPLSGTFSWYSAAKEADVVKPHAQCVIHMFNHQTHHRGQLHQMLTETGSAAPVSDLVFMPEEA
ncbi:DinB family protein [Ruegeria sp. 2205SS24-7]|uniref:DinB family protein n=1 Tax=Ruegeria discodermiae TaxID=3064389 RepID=UPI002741BAB5|nr:DinB family protein [Ruegeria sp. 2205SS24-7]MDP5216452.1 DinB family protein [Ruegeria sp. 2205SS24-7]